ncbi:CGNR zinc finger domain-containing protein [Plantactinospora sp. S1510]|uniref:CGNR zinc finger domain-containing protein n=1 Tax=Plantactinospora alkalitolerans TaxID=2789879 RepID=A0ABS0H7X5_9ACTN|nr:CGNR zinc finger domain-containing protein [Plantactinospora alkalitolerans]MBF9134576.1 CGNR zinc finger domain-containing protein [Plantactinospora alkalitolerans]
MKQPGDRTPAPGRLALVQDLLNTVDIEADRDRLRTIAELAAFAAAHGCAELTFTDSDVTETRRFREALRDACRGHTGAKVPAASAAVLRYTLGTAPLVLTIDDAGAARAVPAGRLDGSAALIATVAAAILDAVAAGTWPRLKSCAAHRCQWVYYDHSPAGRGRWCTMSICGSRAKMRAYRAARSARS